MKSLFVLNDPPYGTERMYNALRLALALLKQDAQADVTVFVMADAVVAAKAGHRKRLTAITTSSGCSSGFWRAAACRTSRR